MEVQKSNDFDVILRSDSSHSSLPYAPNWESQSKKSSLMNEKNVNSTMDEDFSYLLQPMSWTDNKDIHILTSKLEEAQQQQCAYYENYGTNSQENKFSASTSLNLQPQQQTYLPGGVPFWQQSFPLGNASWNSSTNASSQQQSYETNLVPMPLPMSSAPTSCSTPVSADRLLTSVESKPSTDQQQYLPSNSIQVNMGTLSNSVSALTQSKLQQDSIILTPPLTSGSVVNITTETASSSLNYEKMEKSTRNVRLRLNTRMDMDRLKAQEEDKREKERQEQQRQIPFQQSSAVPMAMNSQPAVNVAVPSTVLQVYSALENPTPFHVEQTRRLNIKQYCEGIANSLPDVQESETSFEGNTGGNFRQPNKAKLNVRLHRLMTDGAVSSAPPNYSTNSVSPIPVAEPVPSSPGCPSLRSSVATSINDEFEESILDLILTDEKSHEEFLTDHVASLPHSAISRISNIPEASTSCPVEPSKEGVVKLSKDRIKKDNHNKIERKRRFHINDMITEQSRLLPKSNERHHEKIGEVKQNKGSILKASVDYTKVLKEDNESLHHKLQKAEYERKELLLKLQRLEQICSEGGVSLPDNIVTWKTGTSSSTSVDEKNILSSEVRIKQEQSPYNVEEFEKNLCEMMDEDRTIVIGSDPMFSQVESDEGFHHSERMDFSND